MDRRLVAASVVELFARDLAQTVALQALYATGSLASGDYRPGISDLDLVAVLASPVEPGELRSFHVEFARAQPAAARIHCIYVPREEADAPATPHVYWANGRLLRRPLSALARAELHADGIVVHGPPPGELFPPVDDAELRTAARRELTGYWRRATRRPWLWLDELHVDLGLLTLARAEATLADGRLIGKAEALARLPRFGVPPTLCKEIARRRLGEAVHLSTWRRVRRALLARRLVACGIRKLTR